MEYYKFFHPSTCTIAGPSNSGKTVCARRLLKHFKTHTNIMTPELSVLWCYGQWQPSFNSKIPNVNISYVSGLPTEDDLNVQFIVLDDLMSEVGDSKFFSDLFTKGAHHRGLSVIFITQNLFHQGKVMRTVGLNCNYYYIMKSIRGKAQLRILARDTFPGKTKALLEAYDDATKDSAYSYIRLDFTQQTPDKFRVMAKLFPEETNNRLCPVVYILK